MRKIILKALKVAGCFVMAPGVILWYVVIGLCILGIPFILLGFAVEVIRIFK